MCRPIRYSKFTIFFQQKIGSRRILKILTGDLTVFEKPSYAYYIRYILHILIRRPDFMYTYINTSVGVVVIFDV